MDTAAADGSTARRRDVIVVGASAGGVEVLKALVGALPAHLPASLFVVLHVHPHGPSMLPAILARETRLPVRTPVDGERIEHGCVYVAPPDRHLLLEDGRVRTVLGPKENGHRPSVDVLFRSAAAAYGDRVVGIVLTGTLSDGALGLAAVRSAGGVTVIQDPAEAPFPDMPKAVRRVTDADHCLRVGDIAGLIERLAGDGPRLDGGEGRPAVTATDAVAVAEGGSAEEDRPAAEEESGLAAGGRLSPFTCPACGGALWELDEQGELRYRCHVGHSFSPGSLEMEQDVAVEDALYAALRALKERAGLLRRLAEEHPKSWASSRTRYMDEADDLERKADVLRRLLSQEAA